MPGPARCRCGRPLRDPVSVARGAGPVCARRLGMTAQPSPTLAKPAPVPGSGIPGQTALPLQLGLDTEQIYLSNADTRTGEPL